MGRKITKVHDSYGNELYQNGGDRVIRVQHDKANNTYILLDGKKKILSRREKKDIVAEYYKFIGRDVVNIPTNERQVCLNSVIEDLSKDARDIEITVKDGGITTATDITPLSPEVICMEFAKLYYKNPITAEALTQIPNLAKLASMDFGAQDKAPQILLEDIIEAYLTNPAYEGKSYITDNAKNYWNEFVSIINREAGYKIKYLSKIKPEWVEMWETEINRVALQKNYYEKAFYLSPIQKAKLASTTPPRKTWQRKRVHTIKGIIENYRIRRIHDPNCPPAKQLKDFEYSLDKVKAMSPPKNLPKIIEPDVFEKLYKAASDRMKNMMLVAVQCSFTQVDLINLRTDDINWETGELNKNREKEDTPRVAYIDARLLKKLKEIQDGGDFVYYGGERVQAKAISKEFEKLKEAVKLPQVNFKQLRKTAITKAGENGASGLAVDILAGHSCKINDAYIGRTLKQVKAACESIAKEYFEGLIF